MKIEFYHIATHKGVGKDGLESPFKEYIYNFRLSGTTYQGEKYTSDYWQYCSVQLNAKDAKKDIKQRLVNQGVFDAAMDGLPIGHLV